MGSPVASLRGGRGTVCLSSGYGFFPILWWWMLWWWMLFICVGCVPHHFVQGWTCNATDTVRGPCVWESYAPDCSIPPACSTSTSAAGSSSASSSSSSTQKSPISFTTEVQNASLPAGSVCIQRVPPYDVAEQRILAQETENSNNPSSSSSSGGGGDTAGAGAGSGKGGANMSEAILSLSNSLSSWKVGLSESGVLEAKCFPNAPLYIRLFHCESSTSATTTSSSSSSVTDSGEEEKEGKSSSTTTTVLFDDTIMQVVEMRFYNGEMNSFPQVSLEEEMYKAFETTFFLVYATSSSSSSSSSTSTSTTATTSYLDTTPCSNYTIHRQPPDLLLSFNAMASSDFFSVNSSVFVALLNEISSTTSTTTLAHYSSLLLNMADSIFSSAEELLPLLPLPATDTVQFPASFYYYVGSLGEPPCTPQVPHLVLRGLTTIPMAFFDLINTSSNGVLWNSGGVLLQPVLNSTKIYEGSFYQLNVNANTSTLLVSTEPQKVNEEGEGASLTGWKLTTEAVLVAVDILLFGFLLILCLTRQGGLRRSFPLGLGGLNYRVVWDLHSYEKAAEMAKLYEKEEPPQDDDEGGGGVTGVEVRHRNTIHGELGGRNVSYAGQQQEQQQLEEIVSVDKNIGDDAFF